MRLLIFAVISISVLSGCLTAPSGKTDFTGWTIADDRVVTVRLLDFSAAIFSAAIDDRNYGYKVIIGENKIQIKTLKVIQFLKIQTLHLTLEYQVLSLNKSL